MPSSKPARRFQPRPPITVAAISLGCPKNQVDTENLLAVLGRHGLKFVDDADGADWLVVNTCAFIRSAEEETVEALIQAAALKRKQGVQRLIVIGCLVKKHGEGQLQRLIPEIDLALPPQALHELETRIQPWLPRHQLSRLGSRQVRPVLSGPGTAYLKVAEGCSRRCAFCLIPQLRGPLHSLAMDAIVEEAQHLVRAGARELVLVAQDTTSYGQDLDRHSTLPHLIDRLVKIRGLEWLRLMYLNPDSISEALLQRFVHESKVVPYIDMPIQHARRHLLRRMRRNGSSGQWLDLITRIRRLLPEVSLRTTVLTGFPGETETDHQALKIFLQKARFDRLGVFTYSKEAGTAAANMTPQVHPATKLRRQREIMLLQEPISQVQLHHRLGRSVRCLVEEASGRRHVLARTPWDAPEIDGAIILRGQAQPGSMVTAEVTGATIHDLEGIIL